MYIYNRVLSSKDEDLDFGIDIPHNLESLTPDKQKHLNDLVNLVEPDVNALVCCIYNYM